MKNITNSESIRTLNGGSGVTLSAVLGAMSLIYGVAKTGYSLGTAIGRKFFK